MNFQKIVFHECTNATFDCNRYLDDLVSSGRALSADEYSLSPARVEVTLGQESDNYTLEFPLYNVHGSYLVLDQERPDGGRAGVDASSLPGRISDLKFGANKVLQKLSDDIHINWNFIIQPINQDLVKIGVAQDITIPTTGQTATPTTSKAPTQRPAGPQTTCKPDHVLDSSKKCVPIATTKQQINSSTALFPSFKLLSATTLLLIIMFGLE